MKFFNAKNTRRPGKLLQFLAMALMLLGGRGAWATCTQTTTGGAAVPNNLIVYNIPGFSVTNVNANAALNAQLYTVTVPLNSVGGIMNCTPTVGIIAYRGTTGAALPGYSNPAVYPTGIPGVGVEFAFPVFGNWPYNDNHTGQTSVNINPTASLKITFIKTIAGPLTAGGVMTGEIGGAFAEGGVTQTISYQISGSIPIQPKVPTCSVDAASSQTVTLPTVAASLFANVGDTAGQTPFNVTLTCSGGDPSTSTNMWMYLTDATNTGNTTTTLSPAAGSVASGIGFQVLYGTPATTLVTFGPEVGASVKPSNAFFIKNVPVGTTAVSIPMAVQYIRTGSVTGGTISGIATFDMVYQ